MVFKVALAAFIHDIGKLLQASVDIPRDYEQNNADLYLPYDKKKNIYTHKHALYTAYFLESNKDLLPRELNSRWGEGPSFINLAAKHHNPEEVEEWVVTEADRLSSGHERVEFEGEDEITIKDVYKTRLVPVFEYLLIRDKTFESYVDFDFEYPLEPITAQSIFPRKRKKFSEKEAASEYDKLYKKFIKSLKKLYFKEHVKLWARSFDSLCKIYLSLLPAARVGKVIPDVSLYDHCRSTAAIAAALYLYHIETNSLNVDEVLNKEKYKFLLISGDFYGIQQFIFRAGGEERHHRAKLLRGRSFQVSLLTDLAAEFLCEKIGLPFFSIMLSAAGKFHILAPNTEKTRENIEEVKEELQRWFYKNFYGETGIGLSYTEARPLDFLEGNFQNLWLKHLQHLEEAKYNRIDLERYGGKVEGYLDSFNNSLNSPLCPLCGKSPSHDEVLGDPYIRKEGTSSCSCKLCRDQVFIGTRLVKREKIAILKGKGELKEPLFNDYQIRFIDSKSERLIFELPKKGNLIKLLDVNVLDDGSSPVGTEFLPINGHIPIYTKDDENDLCLLAGERSEAKKLELIDMINRGEPKTFYHIANKSLRTEEGRCYGVAVLGALKLDVDNLGAIFGCGLPEKMFTISRLATMSRQLNSFFALYLPYALRCEKDGRFREIYTIFAGGDDLFLIGPWNRIIELSLFLNNKFKEFVCGNPEIHFSAGITLHKPYTPVEKIATESEEALSQSKDKGRNRITIFFETSTWDEFSELMRIKEVILEWHRKGFLTKSLLYRINGIADMASLLEKLTDDRDIHWKHLHYAKWPAFLRYFLVRNISRTLKENWEDTYSSIVVKLYEWISQYGGRFFIALWPLLYELREQRI